MNRFRGVYHDQTLDIIIAPAKDILQLDGLRPSVDEGLYKKEAPYTDPYDLVEPIHSPVIRGLNTGSIHIVCARTHTHTHTLTHSDGPQCHSHSGSLTVHLCHYS